jgi:hypothetical protein
MNKIGMKKNYNQILKSLAIIFRNSEISEKEKGKLFHFLRYDLSGMPPKKLGRLVEKVSQI